MVALSGFHSEEQAELAAKLRKLKVQCAVLAQCVHCAALCCASRRMRLKTFLLTAAGGCLRSSL